VKPLQESLEDLDGLHARALQLEALVKQWVAEGVAPESLPGMLIGGAVNMMIEGGTPLETVREFTVFIVEQLINRPRS
jgi:hypothetical protein